MSATTTRPDTTYDNLRVPTGREMNRARLYDIAVSALALPELFDPLDVEAVAQKLENERHLYPESHMQHAIRLLAAALRRAADIPVEVERPTLRERLLEIEREHAAKPVKKARPRKRR